MPTKENIMHNNKTNKCTYYCEYCTTKIPIMYPINKKQKIFTIPIDMIGKRKR